MRAPPPADEAVRVARYRARIDRLAPRVLAALPPVPPDHVVVLALDAEGYTASLVPFADLGALTGRPEARLREEVRNAGGAGFFAVVEEPGVPTYLQFVSFHLMPAAPPGGTDAA